MSKLLLGLAMILVGAIVTTLAYSVTIADGVGNFAAGFFGGLFLWTGIILVCANWHSWAMKK